jgi:hypothetical protein
MQARNKVKTGFFKKSLKKGSSLFELLVYMAIGLVLLSLGSLWVQHAYIPFSRASAKIALLSSVASGLTVLKHDLYSAPSNQECWKKITEHELVWAGQAGPAICWCYQDGELVRIEGSYDLGMGAWTQATKSTVAQQIEQFSFGVNYVQLGQDFPTVASIKIGYRVAGADYTQLFTLRDRIFVSREGDSA